MVATLADHEGKRRCWCNRLAAYGTDYCFMHGARRVEVQLAADTGRLETAVREHLAWLAEVEVRWVRCGGSPACWRRLVREGRAEEAAGWVERVEAGWWPGLPAD